MRPDVGFTCVICQHDSSLRWNSPNRRDTIIPPICTFCEGHYTDGIGLPSRGAFRDRREVKRGFAVAEALHTAARLDKWRYHVPS